MQLDVKGNPRALMPDYLRLIALFGICIVNVQFIAFSALSDPAIPYGKTGLDFVVVWLVNGVASCKSYGLFSFMFGVGFGMLMLSAAQNSFSFPKLYRQRLLGLLILGLAHGCFFFYGDILTIYAIVGAILYRFRNWQVRRLAWVGATLVVLQVILWALFLQFPSETPADVLAFERVAMSEGPLLKTLLWRTGIYFVFIPLILISQGIAALGWFCLGLAAFKSGMIGDSDHPLWRVARRWCLVPGILLSLVTAAIWQWGPTLLGNALTVAVAPVATLGYLGLVAALARSPGPTMTKALNAGGSSLSIYLGQSIVLSTVFSPYGLGLWNEVDRLTATAIAFFITLALIIFVSIWKTRFALGPFEWVLRSITYAGQGRST